MKQEKVFKQKRQLSKNNDIKSFASQFFFFFVLGSNKKMF